MTKLEKNLLNAIDDAENGMGKVIVDDAIDDGKCFFVKCTTKTLALYWGNEKVVTIDSSVYTALAVNIFREYIKF